MFIGLYFSLYVCPSPAYPKVKTRIHEPHAMINDRYLASILLHKKNIMFHYILSDYITIQHFRLFSMFCSVISLPGLARCLSSREKFSNKKLLLESV